MKLKIKNFKGAIPGFAAGILNGLLGAGGGMVIVPMLEKSGLEPTKSHATSIAVIVPLCILSAAIYLFGSSLSYHDVLPFLPAGFIGAFVGSIVLPHIPARLLRRIFGAFMLYSSWRLLMG
ncbi:MAG TPA: sulfite exporter TauE/SafE family protein [Ruminiclostridium sp.]|nr:sulfite exporter TauE/SafE family protein [Ruminiclostridium sp.]